MGSTPEDSAVGEGFVGRAAELTRLRDLGDLAVETGTQLVLVSGEAGIGKTTLARAFLQQLTDSGWGGHVGKCVEYADRPLPFGPIVGILQSVLLGDLDSIDDLVGPHRDDLTGLLPELGRGTDGPAPLAGDVDRLFHGIAATLAAATERRPQVVLIEDIHWADPATRDLISHLANFLGRARLLVIVTERSGATDRSHPLRTWIAEQRRLANVHAMEITGLSREELETQALGLLGEAPERSVVDDLVTRTGGNPYFAHELLVSRREGNRALPTTLVEFLSSRLDRLDDNQRALLRALAVLGGTADHRRLGAMLPDLDVPNIVRSLFDASVLVVVESAFAFPHALLREAVLADVLPFEAEDLHRRAAEAIEADPATRDTLAGLTSLAVHHGAAADADRSLAAAVAAADAAAAVAAYETAADMTLQALAAWPAATDPEPRTGRSRSELLLQAADHLVSCYRGEQACELITDALAGWARTLAPGQRALLLARMAPIQWHLGNPGEPERLLTEAERLIGDEVSTEAAQVHHRVSKQALADGQIHPARDAAERAIAIAETEGPTVVLVEALTTLALALGVTGDLDGGIEQAQRAREMALSERMVPQVANTYRTEMLMRAFQEGRTEACLEASRQGLAYAEQHCGPRWRAEFRLDLCVGLLEAGRLPDAAPLVEVLLESELDDLRRLTALQAAGLLAMMTGTYAAAEIHLDAATEIAERYQSAQETGHHSRLLAELARRRGRPADALPLIDAALTLQLAGDNLSYTRESIVEKIRIVRAQAAAGTPATERQLADLAAVIEQFDGSGLANSGWKALMELELAALTGTVDTTDARRAIEMIERSGFLFEGAQARLLLIEHLQTTAAGDADSEVAEELEAVLELAAAHGMTWITRGAEIAARGAGIAVKSPGEARPEAAGALPHHLTMREVEVMSLLADGLTNKAIGERLYVSPRTVSTHVSNLLAKVGATNRGEAAAIYHRLGLGEVIDLREADPASPTKPGPTEFSR